MAEVEATVGSLEQLRVNFLKAAEDARKAGDMRFLEYRRVQRVGSKRVWNSYDEDAGMTVGAQIQTQLVEKGVENGVFAAGVDVTSIDWTKLLEFIKGIMPLIQMLIALFA